MKSYGTLADPWPELPPAASLYSVQWAGGSVIWQTQYLLTGSAEIRDTSRLNADATGNSLDDSARGTAAFWVSVLHDTPDASFEIVVVVADAGTLLPQFPPVYNVLSVGMQNGLIIDGITKVPGWALNLGNGNTGQWVAFLAHPDSIGNIVGKWSHILVNWDFAVPAASLWVNGAPQPLVQGGDAGTAPPARWGTGAEINFFPAYFFEETYSLGLQDVWIDNKVRVSDPSRFFDAATGRGKPLGANGELPIDRKPLFFFHGNPAGFVQNLGTDGPVTLIGDAPRAGSTPSVEVP